MNRSFILLMSALAFLLPAISQAGPLPARLGTEVPPPLVPPHSWPAYNFSPGNDAYNYYENTLNSSNVYRLRSYPLPAVQGGGVIANGMAFVKTPAGVQAVQLASGEVTWTWPHVVSIVTTDGQEVYAAANPACPLAPRVAVRRGARQPADCPITDLVALDNQTGALRWDLPISPTLFCCEGLHLARGRLYFGVQPSGGGTPSLEAVDTRTGQVAWQTPVAGLGPGAYGTYRGHPVFYVIAGMSVQALNAVTGRVVGTISLPTSGGPPSSLMDDGTQLYVTVARQIMAFDHQGRRRWEFARPHGAYNNDFVPTAAGEGGVYGILLRLGGKCQCQYYSLVLGYSAATGKPLWPFSKADVCGDFCSQVVLANGLLYTGATVQYFGATPFLNVINAKTGAELTSQDLPESSLALSPEIVDGTIYMLGDQGSVYFSLN